LIARHGKSRSWPSCFANRARSKWPASVIPSRSVPITSLRDSTAVAPR
jgi:hypothetical protein